MTDDLDTRLAEAFQPLPVYDLAAVKGRGQRQRRRRRAGWGALTVAVAAAIVGLVTGPLASGPHVTTIAIGGAPASTTNTAPPATTTPPVPSVEPATFVAEMSDDHVAVVNSRTGGVIRQLAPAAGDVFGPLSADGTLFYLDGGPGLESTCPSGFCAVNVATGATTPIPAFQWGSITPSSNGTPISPDGTHAVTTNFAASPLGTLTGTATAAPTVTIATTTGPPVTYTLPAADQVYADPLWSANGDYLNVANTPTSTPVVMNTASGTLTTLQVPAGCTAEPFALSDTELFADQTCKATGINNLARYQLATGTTETPLTYPPGTAAIIALGTDPTGGHLIASTLRAEVASVNDQPGQQTTPANTPSQTTPAGGSLGQVWTEENGTWTAVPGVQANALAW